MRTLTSAAIERTKPPSQGQVDYFDKGYPGLALRCSYGGAKTFIHIYRLHGKLRRRTLGRFPGMTLAKAREAWRQGREAVDVGEDPARRASVAPDTFEAVAEEWIKRDQAGNRTVADVRRIIAREATSAWAGRLIATITRRDVLDLIDGVVDRGHAIAARRLHAHLHRLFRWAVGRGIIERSPMTELPKPGAAVRRDRVLSDAELAAVWKATAGTGSASGRGIAAGWPFGPIFKLLILTGARRDEMGALRWSEIVGDEIRLAGARTKNGEPHVIPLSAPAAELILSLHHVGDSDYVFTTTGETHVTGWSKAKHILDRAVQLNGKPLPPWRIHDFRRTTATGLQRLGIAPQAIEAVIGHIGARAGLMGVYQRHDFAAEKRVALDAWAREVERIVAGEAAPVIAMVRRQKLSHARA